MVVPTGLVLFFTVAGKWKEMKTVEMAENKKYWELHGENNKKNQSRMQKKYSPVPEATIGVISAIPITSMNAIDDNSAVIERLEQLERELVAIRAHLLASKIERKSIEQNISEIKLASTIVGGDVRDHINVDETVSEEEEETEEEADDVPHKLTTMQYTYILIMYLRSVTLDDIVLSVFEKVKPLASPELLLRTLMDLDLQPPTASSISDFIQNINIHARSSTDFMFDLIGIETRADKGEQASAIADADDMKGVSRDREHESNNNVVIEVRNDVKTKEAAASKPQIEQQILSPSAAVKVAANEPYIADSVILDPPHPVMEVPIPTPTPTPTPNTNKKHWWMLQW